MRWRQAGPAPDRAEAVQERRGHAAGCPRDHLLVQLAVDQHAMLFHARQHWNQGHLDVLQHCGQAACLRQARPQVFVELQRDVGVLGRVRRGRLEVDLVEGQLLLALAGNRLEVGSFNPQGVAGQAVDIVAAGGRIEDVGLAADGYGGSGICSVTPSGRSRQPA